MSHGEYLLADQPSELERLQLQSRVWEPSGRQLLAKIGAGIRVYPPWMSAAEPWAGSGSSATGAGPPGRVVGTDVDERLLHAARSFLEAEGIANVELAVDDLFDSKLGARVFRVSTTPAT